MDAAKAYADRIDAVRTQRARLHEGDRQDDAWGGGDARYDIDFPARDHVLVEQLRNKGAIIFAKAVNTEYNGRAG